MNNSITSQNAPVLSDAAYDAVTSIDSYVQMAAPLPVGMTATR